MGKQGAYYINPKSSTKAIEYIQRLRDKAKQMQLVNRAYGELMFRYSPLGKMLKKGREKGRWV